MKIRIGTIDDFSEPCPDHGSLDELYSEAFPNEDLLPLIRDLQLEPGVLSLVAVSDKELLGHIAFTMCNIAGQTATVALLAPLAVFPDRQRQGIGGALIREGLQRLKASGVVQVQVLGDPAYYGRFGFKPDVMVAPPYALPPEWRNAWQCIRLRDGVPCQGVLSVPRPWQRASLWGP